MSQFNNLGDRGWYKDGSSVFTFQLGEDTPMASDTTTTSLPLPNMPLSMLMTSGGTRILPKGINNMLPDDIKTLFGTNRILPELFDKQYRLLYGKGLFVYKQVFENKKLYRYWQNNESIENWLGDWQTNKAPDNVETYIEKVIKDAYWFEDYNSKWRFLTGRRIGRMPVASLEHIENRRCRLGTSKAISSEINTYDYVDRDFNKIVVGNWGIGSYGMKSYPRFFLNQAFNYETAIAYHKHHTPGEIYGMNKFYFGIKDWLTSMNRNPAYINSYLENSLSAQVHVIIPNEWVTYIEEMLEDICRHNADLQAENKSLVTANDIEVGTEYHKGLLNQYIKAEMRKLTNWMTGVKNQGKTWVSYKYKTSEGHDTAWEIVPLDRKYQEYIKALDDHDKRADQVVTSAIGVDPTISNISKDGVFSKSGSDSYYNYIIYLHANLPTAEKMVCEDINWAISLNFPALYKQGYRVGFYTEIPQKQEEVSPDNRLSGQLNGVTQHLHAQQQQISELTSAISTLVQNGRNN